MAVTRKSSTREIFGVLLLVLCALLAGCDDGEGDDGPPTEPMRSITFTSDTVPAGATMSLNATSSATSTTFVIQVVANDVTNVFTADFTLNFPGSLLRFEGAQQGPLLGNDASLIVAQISPSGSVTLFMTRLATTGASGDGVLVTLTFTVTASGTGRFSFVDPEAEDPFGTLLDIDWIGGGFSATL